MSRRMFRVFRCLHEPIADRFVRDRRGAAAVEFGLFVPLFLMLFLGALEIGTALHHHHIIVKGVRDAARFLTRRPFPFTNADLTDARNLALRGTFDPTAPLLLSYWDNATTEIAVAPTTGNVSVASGSPPSTAIPNTHPLYRTDVHVFTIRVTANVQYSGGLLGPMSLFLSSPITFVPYHEERYIGE